MIDILRENISSLVTATAVSSGFGFFIKRVFDKKLEEHKALLKSQHDKDLEQLKLQHQRVLKRIDVVSPLLHERRANYIINLYIALVDLRNLTDYFFTYSGEPVRLRKVADEVHKNIINLYADYKKAKIFLSKGSCEKIENVLNAIEDPTTTYLSFLNVYEDFELDKIDGVRKREYDQIRHLLPDTMNNIEEEFREILGVYS
ncbi:hypothetical protein AAFX60_005640 [Aliivibrio fischeri]